MKNNLWIRIVIFYLLLLNNLFMRDAYSAPVTMKDSLGACLPHDEVCGDGVDQDCNGSDILCSGSDKDRDGYAGSADCDDTNRTVYSGIYVSCNSTCGTGTKMCQSNGSFSECSCEPLCEATGTGKCYYVSRSAGNDSTNTGTFSSPWRSYLNFVSYYSSGERPAKWVKLMPGDVVYFMSGTYDDTFPYWPAPSTHALFFRGTNGSETNYIKIKSYPGHDVKIAPPGQQSAIFIKQSSYFVIEGIEIPKSYTVGVRLDEASNIEIKNMWIHDIDGVDNNNIGGVSSTASANVRVHHSILNDNYDRANSDTGGIKTPNSRNFVAFGGGNIRVDHNTIFHSPAAEDLSAGGACVGYKHVASLAGSKFEVDHNVLWHCYETAIGSGTFNSHIHHNLILDSDSILFKDFGGGTKNADEVVEYNTIVRGEGMRYSPTEYWSAIGPVTFRKNIIFDNYSSSYRNDRGFLTIGTYSNDDLYVKVVENGNLDVSNNCYYNPNQSLIFSLFAANGGNYGIKGDLLSLSEWLDLGFDTTSVNEDPELNSEFLPTNSNCVNFGAGVTWSPLGLDANSLNEDPKLDPNFLPTNSHCSDCGWGK